MRKGERTSQGERTAPLFRYAETKVPRPARQLKSGQMVSVSPQETIQLTATVAKISDNQIGFRLARPNPKHPIQEGEQVRIKC